MSTAISESTNSQSRSSGPIGWAETGRLPDTVIRAGIRRLNRQRLVDIRSEDIEWAAQELNTFVERMGQSEIAPVPELANEQHYEVPAGFFDLVLGRHRKYSSCYWADGIEDLDSAEAEALRITCRHAAIENGMKVLDLGCGWGSLSLWIATYYPDCSITSVSNSSAQKEFIDAEARARGLDNVRVLTRDMNGFDIDERFDRVVSVEMFEHMRNYPKLFGRINGWLNPGGRFFMHIFCHKHAAYEFLDGGESDWMSRHFFSGGIMPSADLPLRFQGDLKLEQQWRWNGGHYERTSNAWLENMDRKKDLIMPILQSTYGGAAAELWFQRWRIFFMACAELFGHNKGNEWFVSHYRFARSGSK